MEVKVPFGRKAQKVLEKKMPLSSRNQREALKFR
jgi:hypothetical protein